MKIKKHKIPIYRGELIIIKTEDLKEVADKYDLEDLTGFDACVFRDERNPENSKYVMAFSTRYAPIIAHECLHFVGFVFEDRRIAMNISNDEPQCYLLEWAFEKCYKYLNRQ